MRSSISSSCAPFFLVAMLAGQSLVRDIRVQGPTSSPGSNILDLTDFGAGVLFGAWDHARGGQLWRTDGTAAGTAPVTAFPADNDFSFQLWTMVARNGYLVFPGGPPGDREPWRTDGTRTGTYRIADIRPGPFGSSPRYFTPAGNLVFFTADDGIHGEELWRTDGTAAGTFMVADLDTASFPHVFWLTEFGNRLVFSATLGRDPWITDGTALGTTRLRDINATSGAWASHMKVWNGAVWFYANDGVNGYELWRTDGTPAGTALFADIAPGAAGSYPQQFAPAGGRLFFAADDGVHGVELWSTDGTTGGTGLVHDIAPGPTGSSVQKITALGSRVVFAANDGLGLEPWSSDGTAAGTWLLADLEPGPNGSSPHAFRTLPGGPCAFRAATTTLGRELFVTDGTPVGTSLLRDINPFGAHGVSEANNFSLGAVGNQIVFPADDGVHGTELWISDGTRAGTRLLYDVEPGMPPASGVSFAGTIGDQMFFNADDGSGLAAWRTDGTAAGTVHAGLPSGRFLSPLFAQNGRWTYLAQTAGVAGLWSTDGTPAGTVLIAPAAASVFPAPNVIAVGGRVCWVSGATLWSSDGTTAGTQARFTFQPRPLFGIAPRLYVGFQGAAYLVAEHNGAVELWRSDGTTAGTAPITAFGGLSTVGEVVLSGSRLVFVATDPARGTELFVSDGTAAGTRLLADVVPGAGSSYPRELTPVAGGVFFVTRSLGVSNQLWFTDGTPGGERFVSGLNGNPSSFGLTALGAGVLFVDVDAAGSEPWVSDGTNAGTVRILDVRAGSKDSLMARTGVSPFAVVGSGRVALFAANDGERGNETWRTDGTAAGTWRVTDIGAEQISSNPRAWTRLSGRILFAAYDPSIGEELFAMRLVATVDSLAAPRVDGCAGSNGVPTLSPIGLPVLGNGGFALRIANARPTSLSAMWIGPRTRLSLGACTLGTSYAVALVFGLDAFGSATLPLPVPNVPSLYGIEFDAQAFVVDPLGGYLGQLAFTNDLFLVVGR